MFAELLLLRHRARLHGFENSRGDGLPREIPGRRAHRRALIRAVQLRLERRDESVVVVGFLLERREFLAKVRRLRLEFAATGRARLGLLARLGRLVPRAIQGVARLVQLAPRRGDGSSSDPGSAASTLRASFASANCALRTSQRIFKSRICLARPFQPPVAELASSRLPKSTSSPISRRMILFSRSFSVLM